jgi:DNA polymerase III epsilon subunit family exonuclease
MLDKEHINEYIRRQVFLAFDTETTGLWAPVNRVVEIGAVKFEIEVEGGRHFQSLINPERPMPLDVIGVHGITDIMVSDAPLAPDVLQRFKEFVGTDTVMIAHNAPFDIGFLGNEFDRAGIEPPENIIVDTVDIYHRTVPGLMSYSLEALSRRFHLAPSQEHRALADAMLVAELFRLAAPELGQVGKKEDWEKNFAAYRIADWHDDSIHLPEEYAELDRAVREHQRITIVYEAKPNVPQRRTIQTKRIHHKRGTYYIEGFCEKAKADRTFRLDRITRYTVLE